MCWNEDLLGFALERYCPFARLLLARICTANPSFAFDVSQRLSVLFPASLFPLLIDSPSPSNNLQPVGSGSR